MCVRLNIKEKRGVTPSSDLNGWKRGRSWAYTHVINCVKGVSVCVFDENAQKLFNSRIV